MDPIAIGKKIQQAYPQYSKIDAATLGNKYLQKYGGAISGVSSGQIKISDIPEKQRVGVSIGLDAAGYKSPESATKQKSDDSFNSTMALVDKLQERAQGAGVGEYSGPAARLSGLFRGLAGGVGLDSEATSYKDLKEGFTAGLKELTGDTGVLTDQDYDRLTKLIPSLGSTPEEAANKFADMREIIAGKYAKSQSKKPYGVESKGGLLELLAPGAVNLAKTAGNYPQSLQQAGQEIQKKGVLGSPSSKLREMLTPGGNQNGLVSYTGNRFVDSAIGSKQALDTQKQAAGEVTAPFFAASGIKNLLSGGLKSPVAATGEKRILAAAEAEGEGQVLKNEDILTRTIDKIKSSKRLGEMDKQKAIQFAKDNLKKGTTSIQESISDFTNADAFTKGGTRIKGPKGEYNFALRESIKEEWQKNAPEVLKQTQQLSKLFKTGKFLKTAAITTGIAAGGIGGAAYLLNLLTGKKGNSGN